MANGSAQSRDLIVQHLRVDVDALLPASTFSCWIRASSDSPKEALSIFERYTKSLTQSSANASDMLASDFNSVACSILSIAGAARNIHVLRRAWTAFRSCRVQPDLHSFSTYIHGLVRCGDFDDAWATFHEMTTFSGYEPDEQLYSILIHSCAEMQSARGAKSGAVEKAINLFKEMRASRGIAPSDVTTNTLLLILAKSQRFCMKTFELFFELYQVPSVEQQDHQSYSGMKEGSLLRLPVSPYTIHALILACATAGDLHALFGVLGIMNRCLSPSEIRAFGSFPGSSLRVFRTYLRRMDVERGALEPVHESLLPFAQDDARGVWKSLSEFVPAIPTSNAVCNAAFLQRFMATATDALHMWTSAPLNCKADHHLLNSLLHVRCSIDELIYEREIHAATTDEVSSSAHLVFEQDPRAFMKSLFEGSQLQPNVATFTILLQHFSRVSDDVRLRETFEAMKQQPAGSGPDFLARRVVFEYFLNRGLWDLASRYFAEFAHHATGSSRKDPSVAPTLEDASSVLAEMNVNPRIFRSWASTLQSQLEINGGSRPVDLQRVIGQLATM
jgi:pentatricopeptide repeat protein